MDEKWGIGYGPATTGPAPLTTAMIGTYPGALTVVNVAKTQDLAGGVSFQLNDLASVNNFTILYDAYKITKVNCTIEYLNNSSQAGLGYFNPTIWMYYDQDDAATPASLAPLTGKQGVRKHTFGSDRKNKVSFSFTPTLAIDVEASTGNVPGIVAAKPSWVNCAFPNAIHNALKFWISDVPAAFADNTPPCAFRINWTYHVSFRSPIRNN